MENTNQIPALIFPTQSGAFIIPISSISMIAPIKPGMWRIHTSNPNIYYETELSTETIDKLFLYVN